MISDTKKEGYHYCRYCGKYVKSKTRHRRGERHKKKKEAFVRILQHKLKQDS